MKTAIKASMALLLVAAVVTSCKKYDEGPSLSLRGKKGRLAGEWEVEKYMEDGTDKTTDYRQGVTSETLEYEKDGTYKATIVTTAFGTITSEGTWKFINDKEDLEKTVTSVNGQTQSPASVDTTHIIRLTNKEFWTKDTQGSHRLSVFCPTFPVTNPTQHEMFFSLRLGLGALLVAGMALSGCRVGDGDPFLSLRSRKARLSGEWNVSSGEGSTISTNSSGTQVTTWTHDGSLYTERSPSGTVIYAMTIEYEFEKDGAYSITTTKTYASPATTIVVSDKGTWNFTGGVGKTKNKSQLILRAESRVQTTINNTSSVTQTFTYSGSDSPTTLYDLYELRNKEVILTRDGSWTDDTGQTTTQKEKWTLSAK
jgi:hypothetical protein